MITMHKKSEVLLRLLLTVLAFSLIFSLSAQFGGGQGTEEEPYIISNHEHLNNIKMTNDEGIYLYLDAHFLQNADINFTEDMFAEGGVYFNEGTGWIPIGHHPDIFTGYYDGNGFAVANLKINRVMNDQGLFGRISGATIVNTHTVNVDIVCRRESGGLVGHMLAGSLLDRSSSTGSVRCPEPQYQQGGLVGRLNNSIITNSFSEVNVVSGNGRAGGLVGYSSDNSQIINCYATGSVTSSASVCGGLVGYLFNSTLINSYATGDVTLVAGGNQIGGLIGTVGGVSTIRNSYSTGLITGTGGGLIGQGGAVIDCYWDTETSNKPNSTGGAGAMGRTTAQMTYPYDEDTFTEWDFEEIWRTDDQFLPEVNPGSNNGYPYLYYQLTEEEGEFAGGSGTEADPWQIETAEHLNNVRNYVGIEHNDKHFVQTADINLGVSPWNEGIGWIPIGVNLDNSFQGTYDGRRYVISNLTIYRENILEAADCSLFGVVNSATIKNVGLKDASVIAGHRAAGIASHIHGSTLIELCYVSGRVSGFAAAELGGIAGTMQGAESIIRNCYSTATVANEPHELAPFNPSSGGILGVLNNGSVINCYFNGRIEALTSFMSASVIGSRMGGEVENLYWNRDIANREFAIAREEIFPGNTTQEMLRHNTFAGFDFENIWRQIDNFSFPYLAWQEGPHSLNILGPLNLVGQAGDETMLLSWERPPLEAEPLGYNVYVNKVRMNDELLTENEYLVTGLQNWIVNEFQVTAMFEQGESNYSSSFHGASYYYEGSGTEDEPYLVENAYQLDGVRFNLGLYYRQTADIDLGVAPWNEGEGWEPIGNEANPFTGSYDGGFYEVSNMLIDKDPNNRLLRDQALFGNIQGAALKRLILKNADVTARQNTAILTGYADNSSIEQSYASGNINGMSYVGGLAGRTVNDTVISECVTTGIYRAQTGFSYLGGLVGALTTGSAVYDSYSAAKVTGVNRHIGGLIGNCATSGNTYRSYAFGEVAATSPTGDIGGLIGSLALSESVHSYWNIDSSGQEISAGGEGRTTPQLVTRDNYEDWDFNNVWSIAEGATYPYLQWQNEIAGYNIPAPFNVNVTANFVDEELNLTWEMIGTPHRYNIYRDDVYIASVNHPTMNWTDTECELYTYYNYSVAAVFIIDEEELITVPSLKVTGVLVVPFAGGSGSEENPYEVETATHLNNVRFLLDSHYIQTAPIDLDVIPYNEGEGWIPIGRDTVGSRFTGSYNGNNFAITNLFINRPSNYQGLFGYSEGVTFENITLENINISGASYVGGLVAYQNATITRNCSVSGNLLASGNINGGLVGYKRYGDVENNHIIDSYSTVNITGANYTGGLIGYNYDGNIDNCFASGNVTGNSYTGGFAGMIAGQLQNSYARGNVQGTSHVGGLTGRVTTGAVHYSYSSGEVAGNTNVGGLVGSITGFVSDNCYWDIGTSNQETSAGGVGRETRQMIFPYDEMTYVNWNFDDIWIHDTNRVLNDGYPMLHYQYFRLDTPVLSINLNDELDQITISWEAVENANSYRIYASETIHTGDWGEPIAVVAETQFSELIGEGGKRFYYVVASTDEAR